MDENDVVENQEVESSSEPSDDYADLRGALEQAFADAGGKDDEIDGETTDGENEETDGEPVGEENTETTSEEPAQAQLPEDIQNYIQELEVEKTISNQFKQALEPHFDFLQEYQINPYSHVSDLMTVSRTLATGSDIEKAGMIAQLCDMFKVDFEALDNALYELTVKPEPTKEDAILEKLNALEQKISTPQPKNEPVVNTVELEKEIKEFASKNEFFEDVRADMALFLNNGKAKNLEQAYQLAIKINDNVQKTIRQRSEKTVSATRAGRTALRGSSAPIQTKNSSGDLRSVLEAYWDENE